MYHSHEVSYGAEAGDGKFLWMARHSSSVSLYYCIYWRSGRWQEFRDSKLMITRAERSTVFCSCTLQHRQPFSFPFGFLNYSEIYPVSLVLSALTRFSGSEVPSRRRHASSHACGANPLPSTNHQEQAATSWEMADKYLLHVTAGSDYDTSKHQTVLVNSPQATHISSEQCTIELSVRIQNYRGLPEDSPPTSPYFSTPTHKKDQYSIEFRLTPHKDISADNLLFGNDFDRPVRDRLPPGFGTAFSIVKRFIDPGLEGDFYSDRPHLYGCALSSFNVVWVGSRTEGEDVKDEEDLKDEDTTGATNATEGEVAGVKALEEGGDAAGLAWRKEHEVPTDMAARKKWALTPAHQQRWMWEKGREYRVDFFNPYLDFNDFSLKLPGFSISVLGFMGGDDYLRYVLRNKETGDVLFVVMFALVKREDYEKELAEKEKDKKKTGNLDGGGQEQGSSLKSEGTKGVVENRHEGEASFVPRSEDLD